MKRWAHRERGTYRFIVLLVASDLVSVDIVIVPSVWPTSFPTLAQRPRPSTSIRLAKLGVLLLILILIIVVVVVGAEVVAL